MLLLRSGNHVSRSPWWQCFSVSRFSTKSEVVVDVSARNPSQPLEMLPTSKVHAWKPKHVHHWMRSHGLGHLVRYVANLRGRELLQMTLQDCLTNLTYHLEGDERYAAAGDAWKFYQALDDLLHGKGNAVRPVIYLGEDSLLQKCGDVPNPKSPSVGTLIDHMLNTMHWKSGVGIAAPQIGVQQRALVFLENGQPDGKPVTCINPEILSLSKESCLMLEGCISLPGMSAIVPRPYEVMVKYYDQHGDPIETTFQDVACRIFLHEFDHLEGKFFTELIGDNSHIKAEEFVVNISKGSNSEEEVWARLGMDRVNDHYRDKADKTRDQPLAKGIHSTETPKA